MAGWQSATIRRIAPVLKKLPRVLKACIDSAGVRYRAKGSVAAARGRDHRTHFVSELELTGPDLSCSFVMFYCVVRRSKLMLKALILGGTAIATLATPAIADAQYYGYNSGYSYHRDYHQRDNSGAAIAGALVGGILGYALGSSQGYRNNYPYYGYNNYRYQPAYNYSYPSYGYNNGYYNNGYAYQSYGYNNGYGYDRDDDDGD